MSDLLNNLNNNQQNLHIDILEFIKKFKVPEEMANLMFNSLEFIKAKPIKVKLY